MTYAAGKKCGCKTALRLGVSATEFIQPMYSVNGRDYANLYLKFGGGEAYANLYLKFGGGKACNSQGRHRLHLPNFTKLLKCTCMAHHAAIVNNVAD